jgi:hypothetical protein
MIPTGRLHTFSNHWADLMSAMHKNALEKEILFKGMAIED